MFLIFKSNIKDLFENDIFARLYRRKKHIFELKPIFMALSFDNTISYNGLFYLFLDTSCW